MQDFPGSAAAGETVLICNYSMHQTCRILHKAPPIISPFPGSRGSLLLQTSSLSNHFCIKYITY